MACICSTQLELDTSTLAESYNTATTPATQSSSSQFNVKRRAVSPIEEEQDRVVKKKQPHTGSSNNINNELDIVHAQREEQLLHSMEQRSDASIDHLVTFIKSYNAKDGPACIVAIALAATGTSTASEEASIIASNNAFTEEHAKHLLDQSTINQLTRKESLHTLKTRWSITPIDILNGKHGGQKQKRFVCIGRTHNDDNDDADVSSSNSQPAQAPSPDHRNTTVPANGTSQDRDAPPTSGPSHYSSGQTSAEDWLQHWSQIEVSGVEKQDFLDHLDLIRRTDWSKTPLGPMDKWSTVLLSSLGQAIASPFPVLLAWGPDLTQIYNYAYSHNIAHKHPRNMGLSYHDAWPEVWHLLSPPTSSAMKGKATHVNNAQMFLQRKDYLEECYFTWSMIPVYDDDCTIAGIYIPNFDNTLAVVTERRLKLLREASQAFSVDTSPQVLFKRICRATEKDPVDLPLLVFYDCTAADEERELSEHSSDHFLLHSRSQKGAMSQQSIDEPEPPVQTLSDEQLAANTATVEDLQRQKTASTFVRTAYTGCQANSKVFPAEIPPPNPDDAEEGTIATHPSFLKTLRKVQQTHKMIRMERDELKPFLKDLDKTAIGDEIGCIVVMPITTLDGNIRAIAIAGLNPRKAYSDDYGVFLDLFASQISHGITSIRLISEEIRRSRFFAALIKRKNEELHMVLDARTEELKASEQKFVKMAEISPSGIWTVDPSGKIMFVNDTWYKITGHSRDEPADDWPNTVHPDDKERGLKWFSHCLTSLEPIHPLEFRWKQRPGDKVQRWTWAAASPQIDENGTIVAVTGTLTDITEKKLVELHQQHRAEEAIQLRRAQEGFIDMTSHELRNPLSAISLSSDATTERLESMMNCDQAKSLMAQYKVEVEDTLQDMKIISHCCVHMTRLIDDVLTLSKLDNQFLVITPVPCRPADFISETLSIFKGEMASKDITCDLEIKPTFVANKVDYVLTDPSRINQLVINILTNAIKFTAPSKVRKIKVALDCSTTKPSIPGATTQSLTSSSAMKIDSEESDPADIYLQVSISDTGRGLTQDETGNLFQRFRQANAKTHISYGGSGLGLHICRRITELLGGEIGVESVRGKGSTFTFYIPVKRSISPMASGLYPSPGFTTMVGPSTDDPLAIAGAVGQNGRPAVSSPAEELNISFEKLSLLIVEDNLINQRLLDKHLTRVGCVTTCANHGQEAIDLIKQSKWVRSDGPTIDCVLMDIEMPVMDGLTAIQVLRQMEKDGEINGHIPVLAVTANARQEQLDKMLGNGFDGTISKPFKIPIIMDRVRTLLREISLKANAKAKAKSKA